MLRCLGLFVLTPLVLAAPVPEEPARDAGVEKALAFLATQVQPDGSFHLSKGTIRVAGSGLVLLAYLSAGVKPDDKTYGPLLKRTVAALLATQDPDGVFREVRSSTIFYNHGIATWALAEYTLASKKEDREKLEPALKRAVQVIVKGQGPAGGWRYTLAPMDGDLSVTSWQILALRAASRAGVELPAETLPRAMKFVNNCRAKEPGRGFTYVPQGGYATAGCTGAGTLHLLLDGMAPGNPEVAALRDSIIKMDVHPTQTHGLYMRNNQCQALARIGDRESLARLQTIEASLRKHQGASGAFDTTLQSSDTHYGTTYTTALGVLGLTARNSHLVATQLPRR